MLKKSKFRAFCIPIASNVEIPKLLREVYTLDKTVDKASHPTMYAWKTADSLPAQPGNTEHLKKRGRKHLAETPACGPKPSAILHKLVNLNQGFNDNNEGGSGLRILGMLDRLHIVNILVVVSRWYGGTPLGPARFKCISDVGIEALKMGGFLDSKPGKGYMDCLKVK